MKIYWAAPLFTMTERKTNRALAEALSQAFPELDIYLPQDLKEGGRFNDRRMFGSIFRRNQERLDQADIVIAVLDGSDADAGASWEVGYAFGKKKPIVGVRTDLRQLQERGLNIMLALSCTRYVYRTDFDENLNVLAAVLIRAVKGVMKDLLKAPGLI